MKTLLAAAAATLLLASGPASAQGTGDAVIKALKDTAVEAATDKVTGKDGTMVREKGDGPNLGRSEEHRQDGERRQDGKKDKKDKKDKKEKKGRD